jgi:hypothetical protein
MPKRTCELFACLLALACMLALACPSWATASVLYTRYFTINRQTASISISSATSAGTTADGLSQYSVTLSSGSLAGYCPYDNIKDASSNYFYIISISDNTHATIVDMKWNGSTHTPSTGTGTVGEAYSTLTGVAARNRSLTSDNAKEVWYVSGQKGALSDNVSVSSSWTTDSTRYINIKAFPGYEDNGTYRGAIVANSSTSTATITVASKVVYIDDLAIASNGSNLPAITYNAGSSGSTLYVRRCAVKHDAVNGAALLQCGSPTQSATWYLINCIVYSESTSTDLLNTGTSGKFTAYLYNDTFFGGSRGIVRASGTVVCKNCYVGSTSPSNAYVGTFSTASTNNVTWDSADHTPSIGTNPLYGCSSYASYFVSTATGAENLHWRADSYTLFGAGSHGANLMADSACPVTDDIDRQARLGDYFDYGADQTNWAPIFTSANSQSGAEGALLSFTVSATDPEGGAVAYSASSLPGGATFDTPTHTFSWTPGTGQAGTYGVTFTASDVAGMSRSQTVTITIAYVNHAPTLTVPGAQAVSEAQPLTFSVSATDPDSGNTLTYSASGLPSGASFNAQTQTFTWTPAYGQAGNYTVSFSVVDNGSPQLSDSKTVAISVAHVNRPPTLSVPGPQSVNETHTLTFSVSATDPDSGDTLTCSASGLPSGASFNPATRTFSWTPAYGQAGSYTVSFSVVDNGTPQLSDSKTVSITVGATNRAPVLSVPGAQAVNEAQALTFNVSATDPDSGQTLTYSASGLPTGASFNAATRTFSWTPAYGQAGTYSISFSVVDSGSPPLSDTQTVAVSVNHVNRPPVLAAIGNKSIAEGQALTFTLSATDPDSGETLTYSATGLPSGATFDPQTATFTWTPDYDQNGTYPNITFTVTDDGTPQPLSDSEAITITVTDTNRNPVMNPIGNRSVAEGAQLAFTVSGSDPDTEDTLTYSATGLPPGAGFDPQTATFTWTPDYNQSGSYEVTFTATDDGTPPLSASERITVTVTNTNRNPVLNAIGNQSVAEGAQLAFTISGSDPDAGQTLTYSAAGLPAGASFDPQTATFTWTPGYDQAGLYTNVTFTVTDNGNPPLSASEQIAISVSNTDRAPQLGALAEQDVAEGAGLSFNVPGADPDNDPLTYGVLGLPAGAGFDPATGTLTWTPGYDQAGTYTLTVNASDGTLSGSEAVTIVVANTDRPPVLNAVSDKMVAEAATLTFSVSGSDPDGDPLTYTASNLPSGASFDPGTATFAWTPDYGQAGTYQVVFSVSDGSLSDAKAATIGVSHVNRAPVLGHVGDRTVNEAQTLTFGLTASDPDAGDTLSYAASNLPTGAVFDPATRTFTWTPNYSQSGSYQNVRFTVTDNGAPPLAASEAITISVGDVNRPPVLDPIGNKTVNEAQTLSFAVSGSDPDDGQTLSYSASGLPTGAAFDPATRTFTWTPDYGQAGNYQVAFSVTDNGAPMLAASEAITISVGDVNRPPVLGAIGHKTVNEGQPLIFVVTGSDPDAGDTLSYTASNLPPGASFDPATQTFAWTPDYGQSGNYQNIIFTVTDNGTPPASDSEAMTISVGDVNRPPVLNPVGARTVLEGQPLTFTVTATDPDGGQRLTYTASNLPPGAAFDPATQTFTWTPDYGQTGNYQVTFMVTDNGTPPASASESVTISVGDVNRPPVLYAIGNKTVAEGQRLTFTVTGSDPDGGQRLSYTASNLPPGATFDPATQTFTWAPPMGWDGCQITFTVTDDGTPPLSVSETITISVRTLTTLNATLTVKPNPITLATKQRYFAVHISLPAGYRVAEIVQSSLQLSLPDCPECGVAISPSGGPNSTGFYGASFEHAFLRQAPLGGVWIRVAGRLTDGTPFAGEATVEDWKPVSLLSIQTIDATEKPEWQFARNEPILFISRYAVDPRIGKSLRSSLLVEAFGMKFTSPWQPTIAGEAINGFTVKVPPEARIGVTTMKVTLRLRKKHKVCDTVVVTLPVEVLEHSKIDLPGNP